MGSEKTYKAAVIGCGKIAGGYDRSPGGEWTVTHAGAYRLCPRTELAAAADVSGGALAAFGKRWGVESLYADYREMLERERPEIVSLCLPAGEHFEAFRAACAAGARAVFLEKPIAREAEAARRMPALAEGRPVAVNYFRRWNPTLAGLREEIGRGAHGRPLRVTVHYVKGLAENASHFIDLLRWFFGEPGEIRLLRAFEGPEGDPAADFELVFGEGLIATFLHVPAPGYVLHEVDIFTERGRLIVAQRGEKLLRLPAAEEPHGRGFRILRLEGGAAETEWRNCPLRAVEELVGCIEGGGAPACALEDGIRALEICGEILPGNSPRPRAPGMSEEKGT
ncbi:MAG: Gfo/Idh/MocA family oxidoreductase [bacterium]